MKTRIKSIFRGKDYFLYPKTNGKGWIVEWSESGKKASFSNLKVEDMSADAPIDKVKVSAIKNAIARGDYPVDLDKVADALLQAYSDIK